MKKNEIPQDDGVLGGITREMTYVVGENGMYETGQSTGWKVKTDALDVAWDEVNRKVTLAKQKVMNGEASPILYFMEKKIMSLSILASYTGFWKWTIRRHMNPDRFKKLSQEKLKKYAETFEISVEELKQPFSIVPER